MMWVFPLGAAVVSGIFSARLGQQYISRHRPHQLAWALALLAFAIASFAAAMGMLGGWTPGWFRTYFLFGAIINVPILAAGTIYLLGPRKLGHLFSALVGLLVVFAAGAVFGADMNLSALTTEGIPRSRDIYGGSDPVRAFATYASISGFLIVLLGALWSAWKQSKDPSPELRALAAANVMIAFGAMVVAGASSFLRFEGEVGSTGFSIGLLAGVSLMFAGFMKARSRPAADPIPETPAGPTAAAPDVP